MNSHSLVVVGAGPAGMAAAIAAAESGTRVTLIDENPRAGGQIYRQPPVELNDENLSKQAAHRNRGDELRRRMCELADKIDVHSNARVWGVFDSKRLAVADSSGWQMIEAERIILAPGAYELVPPFPGWTLPGVYTPGGAQTMVKSMHVLPGRRAIVVGTGPFLLVVANHLHDAGVEVAAVVDAVRRWDVIKKLPRMAAQPGLLFDGWRFLQKLKYANIPVIAGHVITGASGDAQVERATIAPCDNEWRPDTDRSHEFAVDTVCVGYGFVPRIQLAQLAGCRLEYRDELGGWLPAIDENNATSVGGIWCAGDGAGVAGALVAESEGSLAGWAAAADAGVITPREFDERIHPLKRKLKRLRRFRSALDELSRPRVGLSTLARDDTIVCRCEELTLSEIKSGVDAGSTRMRDLKVATRLGMGPCQGRMCWPSVARWIAAEMKSDDLEKSIEELGPLSVRPPIDPVTLGDLAKESTQS